MAGFPPLSSATCIFEDYKLDTPNCWRAVSFTPVTLCHALPFTKFRTRSFSLIEFSLHLQERLQLKDVVAQTFGLLDAETDVLADQTARECEKFIRVAFLDVEEWNSLSLDLEERVSV